VTAVGTHDQLLFNNTTGSLTFSGNISILGGSGFTPAAGQVFNLIDWMSTVSASWASAFTANPYRDGSADNGSQFDLPDISAANLTWDLSRFSTSGNIVVIPEPSRMLLLALGLLGLTLRRRRQ
jgi:hypothetical protein